MVHTVALFLYSTPYWMYVHLPRSCEMTDGCGPASGKLRHGAMLTADRGWHPQTAIIDCRRRDSEAILI